MSSMINFFQLLRSSFRNTWLKGPMKVMKDELIILLPMMLSKSISSCFLICIHLSCSSAKPTTNFSALSSCTLAMFYCSSRCYAFFIDMFSFDCSSYTVSYIYFSWFIFLFSSSSTYCSSSVAYYNFYLRGVISFIFT